MESLILRSIILVIGGFIGGFYGAAAGSAGLTSLPILLFFGFSPHMAIGTTRPAAVILELVCAAGYRRSGVLTNALIKRGVFLGIAGAAGSTTGAFLLAGVSDQVLRILLATIIASTTVFLFMKKTWGTVEHEERQKLYALTALGAFPAGLYAGFFGFTFGTIITLVLVGFGYTLLQGAALGRIIGAIASAASAVVFVQHGYVDYPSAVVLSIGFGIGGWFGARTASQKGNGYVKLLIMLVVLCSVGKLLFDFLTAL